MSSILTNSSAMVALQTLNGINKDLSQTQAQISTGKMIGKAADNSAIWAISQVMQSDVSGFKAVKASLSLGGSTVAVASAGAEQIVSVLTEMKEKVVAATGENVDNAKITADVNEMPATVRQYADQLRGRSMLVKAVEILPVEAIVRGYITGSGWKEYRAKGTVCDIPLPTGLQDFKIAIHREC